jgi:hypothetical protein
MKMHRAVAVLAMTLALLIVPLAAGAAIHFLQVDNATLSPAWVTLLVDGKVVEKKEIASRSKLMFTWDDSKGSAVLALHACGQAMKWDLPTSQGSMSFIAGQTGSMCGFRTNIK